MSSLPSRKNPLAHCEECSLCAQPYVPPSGDPSSADVFIIGEAPGQQEVLQGAPFVGPSGQLLDYALKEAGADMTKVYKTNVVLCRPPDNREPTPQELEACRERLLAETVLAKDGLVLLGKIAIDAFGASLTMKGVWSTVADRKVLPSYHPAYVLRKPSEGSGFLRDIGTAVRGHTQISTSSRDPEIIVPHSREDLAKELSRVPKGSWVAFDTETDQIQWFDSPIQKADPLLMLQLAWNDESGIVLDDEMLYDIPGVVELVQEFMNDVKLVGHNAKFDEIFLRAQTGIYPYVSGDTYLMHYLMDENARHGLKGLVTSYFGVPDYEEELIAKYLNNRNDRYSKIPFEPFAHYGVLDCIYTLKFQHMFHADLERQGMVEFPYEKVIMPASRTLATMQMRGFAVDVEYMEQVQAYLGVKMSRLSKQAAEIAGKPGLNLDSPVQVAAVVYDQLRMPPPKSRKVGPRSTSHEAIAHLKGKHPFIDALMEYRRVAKMKSSYADNILEAVDVNGRVHGDYLIPGTEVGRLSVRNPALQTIPRPGDIFGSIIRTAFVAEDGCVLLIFDYSQAELRVAACLANEPFLYDVYAQGIDLHSRVAIEMYGENFTPEQRNLCKMFNFSYLYGGNEYSFAMDAGLPINIAKKFVRDYNNVMPQLAAFRKSQFDKMLAQGYVESRFGRRRRFPIVTRANMDDAAKSAVHMPVASTASDLTLLAAIRMEEAGMNPVLTVHDSVICEVDARDADKLGLLGVQIMEGTGREFLPQVAWKADLEVSRRWDEKKAKKTLERVGETEWLERLRALS